VALSRLSFSATLLLLFMGTAAAAVTVDTTVDGDDGECLIDCTIREAVATAIPGETVVVPAGTYTVSLGEIVLDRDLTIIGEGAQHTIIQGAVTPRRVFIIRVGASVEITGVALSLDPVQGNGGGGIGNAGDLLLRECWLRDGIVTNVCCGGALHNGASGTVTIERCTMSNNRGEFAGAIFNEGLMVIENTTISGNSNVFEAGGVLALGSVTLSGSTVVGNEAVFAGAGNISGTFVIRNSVISDGVGGPDCAGVIDATAGYNLDGDGTCVASGGPGNLTAAADLGPLADNGGPVPTHAPAPDSPLVDAGNPAASGSGGDTCSAIDARGVARPQGTACDIGAFELAIGQDCPGGAADDADGDGVCAADDNCPGGFNPGQDAVVFPHSVVASASDRFSWAEAEDVSFVRGNLSVVSVYGTNDGGDLTAADSLTDAGVPAAGSGFYYLLRLGGDCTAGSWQTRLGGQPGRDASLP
ncbi:MAG: choice-of-anchor Q domain-containing protein, partial [Planctomycetota bacterium]